MLRTAAPRELSPDTRQSPWKSVKVRIRGVEWYQIGTICLHRQTTEPAFGTRHRAGPLPRLRVLPGRRLLSAQTIRSLAASSQTGAAGSRRRRTSARPRASAPPHPDSKRVARRLNRTSLERGGGNFDAIDLRTRRRDRSRARCRRSLHRDRAKYAERWANRIDHLGSTGRVGCVIRRVTRVPASVRTMRLAARGLGR